MNMILSLCNIVLNSTGNIWWKQDIQLNGIGYGMMGAHLNLRVTSHDTLFLCIQIWLGVAKCYLWSLFGNGHGKGPHDKAGVVMKQFLHIEQLNPQTRKLQNVEEVNLYMNGCPLDLNNIIVQWSLSIEHSDMWRLGMWIEIHLSSSRILSRGLRKCIQSVLLTRTISFNYLWRV
jgi:hypothetical protein